MNATQRELARLLVGMLLLDRRPDGRRLRRHERTWTTIVLAELLAQL